MSTSLLYHALNIVGYRHRKTEYVGKEIGFTVEQDPTTLRYSGCGCPNVIRRGTVDRRFRAPCFAFKQIIIKLAVQRIQCRSCGMVRQVKVPFADADRRHTGGFERYVLELCRHMTIQGHGGCAPG